MVIQDFLKSSRLLSNRIPTLEEAFPLSDLDEITLYDRARLLEEGIENVENLAHYNFIDLMLARPPTTPRLADLVDQAILYIHLKKSVTDNKNASSEKRILRHCKHMVFRPPPILCAPVWRPTNAATTRNDCSR